MEVKLIDYQKDALALLLYTKNTRLQGEETLESIKEWSPDKQQEHLAYMLDTIKSSWEFCHYIFEINGVSRAFTHQLVRTRNNSYAQESHRTVDASDHEFIKPYGLDENKSFGDFAWIMQTGENSINEYSNMIEENVPPGIARSILPTNISTSIIVGTDLRTLHQMAEVRLCTRTQGEYQDVFRLMRDRVVEVHPWATDFIKVFCANHGTCCFPRYTECPIQKYTYMNDIEGHQMRLGIIKEEHEATRHEANPVAKKGMSQ